MFFYLSKILWLVVAPANFLVLLLLLGAALLFTRFMRVGRGLVVASALGFVALGVLPVGTVMMRVLEDRFPPPPANMSAPAGIIVLGGTVDQRTTHYRGPIELTEGADRMTEAAMLARRFPDAKLVFTGGSAALLGSPYREALAAEKLFLGLGIAPERLVMESDSRNTYENAVLTRELLKPKPGEVWLLVTSAFHMPRSVGIFRKAGFDVTPYPVDYSTIGLASEYRTLLRNVMHGLRRTETALREYIGLAAYRLTGKIDDLFPGP